MDKIAPSQEVPKEVTRESLIAISYSVPDNKTLASNLFSENLESELPVEVDCDGADEYRSELISISHLRPPDMQGLPVALGELKGWHGQ